MPQSTQSLVLPSIFGVPLVLDGGLDGGLDGVGRWFGRCWMVLDGGLDGVRRWFGRCWTVLDGGRRVVDGVWTELYGG